MLIIIFIIFIFNSFIFVQQVDINKDTREDDLKNKFEGKIHVSTSTQEIIVLENDKNVLTLRAIGLNPTVKFKINRIENGCEQLLILNITNISPDSSNIYLNNRSIDIKNEDIVELYSMKLFNQSIIFGLIVKESDEFELRFEKQIDHDNFSYVVLGDTQGRNDIFDAMVSDINAIEPDFILHCGDMTTMGTINQFKEFLSIGNKMNAPLFTTSGNHDIKSGMDNYKKYFGDPQYSFQVGEYNFISLDSSLQKLSKEQFIWLDLISSETNLKNVLFTHVPPYSSWLPDHLYLDPEVPEKLMDKLENNRFDYCFSGHLHLYNYTESGGVEYITTGGGGAALYMPEELGGFHHFITVNVKDNSSEFDVVRIDDSRFKNDYFSLEIKGLEGKIVVDLNDLKTFEYLEGMSVCQNQYANWAGNGTYIGVNIRSLLELVGGMKENDTLIIKGADGYFQEFSPENVYLNKSWLEIQGPLVLAYEYNFDEPPSWSDGYRLVTLPPDHGYSLDDCRKTSMPGQGYWEYESAGARWVKNVVSIIVESD